MARDYLSQIPASELGGLTPRAWLSVGPGFSREEFKSAALAAGQGLVSEAVTSPPEIAALLLGRPKALDGLDRQEILRALLSEPRIAARMTELKRLRRQGNFFRKLDLSIQASRLAAAHPEEEEVYCSRLRERLGENPVREEIRALTRAYEAWLEASALWDPPRLLRAARDEVLERGWPLSVPRPGRIHVFSVQEPESLERSFWEALSSQVEIAFARKPGPPGPPGSGDEAEAAGEARGAERADWELWHTIDDAAERLAESLAGARAQDEAALDGHAVLIADTAPVRRSLKRALAAWGIPEADPRDPNRLQWDEAIKRAFLPLEAVGRGFERETVVSLAQSGILGTPDPKWNGDIAARGIRMGLASYSGGALAPLHARLSELQERLSPPGRRQSCAELAAAHLSILRGMGWSDRELWVVPFFEGAWRRFEESMRLVGLGDRRAPLLYWLERFRERVSQMPSPVERHKPRHGIRVFRMQQLPLLEADSLRRLWILGMPSQWLSAEAAGDHFYGEREREILSAEFGVRSGIQVRRERLLALRAWVGLAQRVTVLDSAHDFDGRERESIGPVLGEVARALGMPGLFPEEPAEQGSHARWLASHGARRPLPPQEIELDPHSRDEISASTLERYSRCPFQALAFDRWRARDLREPDTDLWPDVRGTLLHEAVRLLLESRTDDGVLALSTDEAIDRAWRLKPPMGLIRSRRLEAHIRRKLRRTLEAFRAKEQEYFDRAGARVLELDDVVLRWDAGPYRIVGTPDRIDLTDEGLFVMDYKTSAGQPNGTEMLEKGYRLQLPFYALAAGRQYGRPVIGVQFVELTSAAGRGSGIFFQPWNGKEKGKLTKVRSNSKSLLPGTPEDAWSRLEESVRAHAEAFLAGRFAALPKKPEKECDRCAASDLCGFRRKAGDGEAEGGGE